MMVLYRLEIGSQNNNHFEHTLKEIRGNFLEVPDPYDMCYNDIKYPQEENQ